MTMSPKTRWYALKRLYKKVRLFSNFHGAVNVGATLKNSFQWKKTKVSVYKKRLLFLANLVMVWNEREENPPISVFKI